MKGQKFINAENLPELASAFARSVGPAFSESENPEVKVSLIGEPGVGKSYISAKLSEAVLGDNVTAKVQIVPRENMHDLILWSARETDTLQIIQYDEASTRYVDDSYHDFVERQRAQNPVPVREKPGIVFAEHPDLKTEKTSDIIVRVAFSPEQQAAIARLRESMDGADAETLTIIKNELAGVAGQGCLLEMEIQSARIDEGPLVDFFDPPDFSELAEPESPDFSELVAPSQESAHLEDASADRRPDAPGHEYDM
ncbi:MAG: hypothetical protein KJ017_04130 [Alphaproteobacteria bacterium]|nr:hypothetical protein [Alphaproteobacteria bacterium]